MNVSSDQSEIAQQLKLLRESYAADLPARIAKMRALSEHLASPDFDSVGNADTVRELHRHAHGLAGSGKSYGFAHLSLEAGALEAHLLRVLDDGHAPEIARIEAHLLRLERDAVSPDGLAPSFEPELLSVHLPAHTSDSRLVYLVEDDEAFAADVALQIGTFGYIVRHFADTHQLSAAVARELPDAIIADVIFPEGHNAGFTAMREIQAKVERHIPVLFISARGDMGARLEGVRAGGDAYFTKPIDITDLVDKLDALTALDSPAPYRILIIDDEPALADFFALTLQDAGMHTRAESDPLNIMPALVDFRPDLILMDVYMPQCTGLELATVIRQQEDFVSIPIVFLSAEKSVEKQLAAMSSGADDFLEKPIGTEHLISSVATRAKRSRQLRSFMIRDSLTGLLNHTTIKERLSIEVARGGRGEGALSFAMLDIDNFKSINDRFGHLVGDRVIKSLARLLSQRLRKTDIIGRYGGEEFAVILSETDGDVAEQVLDEIRTSFSLLHHRAADTDFEVTFSCGIAEYPLWNDAATLNDAADKALYAAKRSGKNKVVRAEK